MWQLFLKCCKHAIKSTTMFQLMYNVHTCDHVMCPHFHHPLWDTFVINFEVTNPIDIINKASSVLVLKYYYSTMLWL
jgi:hypothetical protein